MNEENHAIAVIANAEPEELTSFINNLPVETLPAYTLAAERVRKRLADIQTNMEHRWHAEMGRSSWTAPDGARYAFYGSRSWEMLGDAKTLQHHLLDLAPEHLKPLVGRLVKTTHNVDQRVLNTLRDADPMLAEVIEKYRARKEGPPHFQIVEEETK